MSTRLSLAAKRGGSLMHILAACGLCLFLTACMDSETTSGGNSGSVGASGTAKRIVYGISVNVPDGWTIVNSVEPGVISDADLEARVKANPPAGVLAIALPAADPQKMDARVIVRVANAEKHFMPEKLVAGMSQQGFDQQAKNFIQQHNEAARKNKEMGTTLEWTITRETVDGKMAVFQRGLGEVEGNKVRIQIWYIYLPNGMGVALESMGSDNVPNLGATMESIARSVKVAK